MSTDSGKDSGKDVGENGDNLSAGEPVPREEIQKPLVSNNVSSDGSSPPAIRALDYGPDIIRRKPLDVPGRRGGLLLSIIAVLFFGFPPVCLLLSAASAILSVRALRMIEKGDEGRGMPIVALILAFLGAAWSAGYLFWAIVVA